MPASSPAVCCFIESCGLMSILPVVGIYVISHSRGLLITEIGTPTNGAIFKSLSAITSLMICSINLPKSFSHCFSKICVKAFNEAKLLPFALFRKKLTGVPTAPAIASPDSSRRESNIGALSVTTC